MSNNLDQKQQDDDWKRYTVESVPSRIAKLDGVRIIKRDGEFLYRVVSIEHAIAHIVRLDQECRKLKKGNFTPNS